MEAKLSPTQRLAYHQAHSAPVMDALKGWMQQQLADKQVEPNSRLGQAYNYMLKRWEPLTGFLRIPGAPLDNNVAPGSPLNRTSLLWAKAGQPNQPKLVREQAKSAVEPTTGEG